MCWSAHKQSLTSTGYPIQKELLKKKQQLCADESHPLAAVCHQTLTHVASAFPRVSCRRRSAYGASEGDFPLNTGGVGVEVM